ncbi:progestin and adipoQ receptor family member 3-like [Branchiostoma floridae]|uniref:Progestin and adipoQ receptor family member 3-like n=1 Tax=Branchiostoma floridae TaxID=7739 RepID=A0A9J7HWC7_BRAFL|nr:progestin and adipoQ receptor family member 3-like [Branchiostoma floridae]
MAATEQEKGSGRRRNGYRLADVSATEAKQRTECSGVVGCSLRELPGWRVANGWCSPFILNGYMYNLSTAQCFTTPFRWTNETLNFWTSFLAAVYFSCHLVGVVLARERQDSFDTLVHACVLVSCLPCCLSSAAWHLFINHRSERAARLANVADILGVWVAGGGTYVPVFAYGLYCYQGYSSQYLLGLAALVLVLIFCTVRGMKSHPFRLFQAALLHLAPTLALLHVWLVLDPEFTNILTRVVWNKWFSTYMMLFPFMLATYTVKFPERFWPGKFDYIGQSHTLWHCLYIYALYCWHTACWEFADMRQTHPCQVR